MPRSEHQPVPGSASVEEQRGGAGDAPATRVELGCGRTKQPGFIGVDRFPMPGVDIVADLDEALPFPDDSVDLVYASHSLEHVRDLSGVIREVSRICRHGAQLCIVAPYYQQSLNLANPYHYHAFNEHTPRFWTAAATTPIDPAEYAHPHAPSWGLLQSDNSAPDIDIRCVRMEFFYFPEYRNLPPAQQRAHRHRGQDVCDTLVYHLIVLKRPVSDEAFLEMARALEPYDPPPLAIRRIREQCERLDAGLQKAGDYGRQMEASNRELVAYKDRLEQANRELVAYKDRLEQANGELASYKDQQEAAIRELAAERARLEADNRELLAYGQRLEADNQELVAERARLEAENQGLLTYCRQLEADAGELVATRDRLEADNRGLEADKDRLEADARAMEADRGRLEAEVRTLSLVREEAADEARRSREELARLREAFESLSREEEALRVEVSALGGALEEQRRIVGEITSGAGWQFLEAIRRVRHAIAPRGTRRGRVAESLWSLPHRAFRKEDRSLARPAGPRPPGQGRRPSGPRAGAGVR